jgi:hypothetical protein
MITKINKKGSHISLVVSFLIFIVFIAFLRIILEPAIYSNKEKEVILEDIENELILSASSDLIYTSIYINKKIDTNCVRLDDFISEFDFSSGIIVKNKEDNFVPAFTSSGNSNTLEIVRGNTLESYFKIYNSNEFESIGSSSQECTSIFKGTDYNLGITTKKNYIFENLIIQVINDYSSSPQFKLKNSPSSVNIGISFFYSNGTEIRTNEKNVTTDVFVRESPIEYVDNEGNINPGKINIRIW